eukprot:4600347-Amphidinium_carterae.1
MSYECKRRKVVKGTLDLRKTLLIVSGKPLGLKSSSMNRECRLFRVVWEHVSLWDLCELLAAKPSEKQNNEPARDALCKCRP